MKISNLYNIIKKPIEKKSQSFFLNNSKNIQNASNNNALLDRLIVIGNNIKTHIKVQQNLKSHIPNKNGYYKTAYGTKIKGDFKEIHAAKSKLPEVIQLEKRMKKIGYNACFSDNLATAIIITETYENLTNKGYILPKEVALMTPEHEWQKGYRPQPLRNKRYSTPLVFNKKLAEYGQDIPTKTRKKHNTTSSPQGVIYHEIGHFLHEETKVDDNIARTIWKNVTNDGYNLTLENEVGHYAMRAEDSEKGEEFIAEVFAGLMEGNVYSERVMCIYDALGGPKIL